MFALARVIVDTGSMRMDTIQAVLMHSIFKIAVSTALLLASVFGVAQTGNPAKPQKAKWTIMVFMDSDNNLDRAQQLDVIEALAVGGNSDVRIIMLVDRPRIGAKIFEVKPGKSELIADLGNVNMGDPKELVDFVDIAVKQAPAEKYALFFADHGGSWPGFNGDSSDSKEIMTLSELSSALKQIMKSHGRLELIHNDNCLMSCVEMAVAVAPYTKWMTGSAATMPGAGSKYDWILESLIGSPQMDGKQFGTEIIDIYAAQYRNFRDKDSITLSLIDCDQVAPLVDTLKSLGTALKINFDRGDQETLTKMGKARSKAIKYAKSASVEAGIGAIDLKDFCRVLQTSGLESVSIARAITAVQTQLKKTVVKAHNGDAFKSGGGITVNVTYSSKSLLGKGNTYENTLFAQQSAWDKLMVSYQKLMDSDKTPPTIGGFSSQFASLKSSSKMSVKSTILDNDIDEAFFTLSLPANDTLIRIGQLPCIISEDGQLESSFNGMWLYLSSDGQKGPICPISHIRYLEPDNPLGDLIAYVPLEVQKGEDGEWFECTGVFAINLHAEEYVVGKFLYAYKASDTSAEQISLEARDSVRPIYVEIDKDGNESNISSGGEDQLLIGSGDGLAVRDDRLPAGDYFIGFRVTDFGGNIARYQVKVTLEDLSGPVTNFPIRGIDLEFSWIRLLFLGN